MKKIVLILFLFSGIITNAAHVQINFVEGFNIGIINPFQGSPSEGTATTDAAINAVFTNYSVNHCVDSFSNNSHIIFADYYGDNLTGFINELQNNSYVSKAMVTLDTGYYSYTYADILYLKLIDNTIGSPLGTNSNENIYTTNASLNTIFDTYKVKIMAQLNPNNTNYYQIYFGGDINLLVNELKKLPTIVTYESIGVAMLLSNQKFSEFKANIYPNPFSSSICIDSKETISEYSIYELTGKQISTTKSKIELDNLTSKLNPGFYVLNLKLQNGKIANFKLVKK